MKLSTGAVLLSCFTCVAPLLVSCTTAGGGSGTAAKTGTENRALLPPDLTPVTVLKASEHEPVEIVRDGNAMAVVYVGVPKPGKTLSRLVTELLRTVKDATGAGLEWVNTAPAADQPAIIIGDCEETRQAGIDASKLPAEGFVVKTALNRVYLVGSSKGGEGTAPSTGLGTGWAVADFLERIVGARWYWPSKYGGRSILQQSSLTIDPLHYRDQPVFRWRTMYQDWYWLQARSFDEDLLEMRPGIEPQKKGGKEPTLWMGDHFSLMRQGNSWPYKLVQQGARNHEYFNHVPKTNTVMFVLREDGSRNLDAFCLSAPETLAYHTSALEKAWDKGVQGWRLGLGGVTPGSITIWPPMDVGNRSLVGACHCEACKTSLVDGGEEGHLGRFVKRLCEVVKERWPDKTVIYVPWGLTIPPASVEFPDNLVVGNLDIGLMGLFNQPALRSETEDKIRGWQRKSGRRVKTWVDFAGPSDWTYGPVQFPNLVRDFYQQNRETLEGTAVLTYGGACFITAAPTYYVWNRVLWNPEQNVDAILDEMCRRLFGAGAEPARELMQLQCDRWEQASLSRPLAPDDQRIAPKLFNEIWPRPVVMQMRTLRDRALSAIEKSEDAAALQAFLYWTWEFDAFAEYAQMVGDVLNQKAGTATSAAPATDAAAARFRGGAAEVNRARVANVRRMDVADGGQSDLLFDLHCGHSWRAKWTEPAAVNVTGKDLSLENWSAVWVFAKYRLPGDEKLGYRHATLAAGRGQHRVPKGAVLDVGLSEGKGVGVFLYRRGVGHGALDLKDVSLRWLSGADGVKNPAAADVKVFVLDMVYVPEGAFMVGAPGTERGSFTDGAWRDGPAIPFLIDQRWSAVRREGGKARQVGPHAGKLWGTSESGRSAIGPQGELSDGFPTGYKAFYCMRYEVTRGQFTDFLNTVSKATYDNTFAGDKAHAGGHFTPAGRYELSGVWPRLRAARPEQACNLLLWWDGAKFSAWAGLRPMTELEFEKACRGPLKPVPGEYVWGSAGIASAEYKVANEGQGVERIVAQLATGAGNANYDFTMPATYGGGARGGVSAVAGAPLRAGIFATAESDRLSAGASYWGILDLSGNAREQVITVGHEKGRMFMGTHGQGTVDVPDDWPETTFLAREWRTSGKNDGFGSGSRGGFFGDVPFRLRVSDRDHAVYQRKQGSFSQFSRPDQDGWRCVRGAP
ncbi:MAG: DUF4838 domain-containing protein [Kiritimatiellia bacterium]|jgi:hypothetical protein|nr:DUF4838 domain-containing protein [Kiritimatiellia bacterium]MDP6810268.1 DUF4838 domain-containing protein [Kiritimatiellia bacterium]MDP7022743.1 DUF4838 domain-containing protein [Kiritimatiellia bacterium]